MGAFFGLKMYVSPYPHQLRAVERSLNNSSSLFIHPTGSGKTVTALLVAEAYRQNGKVVILVVGPANTLGHYVAIGKRFFPSLTFRIHKGPYQEGQDVSLVSYDMLKRHLDSFPKEIDLTIFDEIHHCKNFETKNSAMAWMIRGRARCFIGMTGTPYQNSFIEFSEIVNLVANSKEYLEMDNYLEYKWDYNKSWFFKRWWQVYIVGRPIRGPVVGFKNEEDLKAKLLRIIDVADEESVIRVTGRPQAKIELIHLRLSEKEWGIYKRVTGRKKGRILERVELDQPNDEDMKDLFNGLVHARQALLIPNYCLKNEAKLVSTKIKEVADEIKKRRKRSLVFCNFVENGTEEIAKELREVGVNAWTYTGKHSEKVRVKIMEEFRAGIIEVLCMSPVGGEGLDIPEAEEIFIADLHFNPEVVRQMIGRALRAGSKNVEIPVRIFLVHGPNGEKTVDDRIYEIFQRKEKLISYFKSLIEN